jgi:hypothetical protein
VNPSRTTAPTLLTRASEACPRCDGRRILGVAVNADNSFAWHECEECQYLWAIPHGWLSHAEPQAPRFGK